MTANRKIPRRGADGLSVLYTARQIRRRVEALANDLARELPRGEVFCVAVLKGSFVFLADLARALSSRGIHPVIDFMALSSYGDGTTTTGRVARRRDISLPIGGHAVLLIDDILDTGLTLHAARQRLLACGASAVRACVLLDKPARRRVPERADHVGFTIDDVFVVGYGLDFDNRYRHLPYLAALSPDVVERAGASHAG